MNSTSGPGEHDNYECLCVPHDMKIIYQVGGVGSLAQRFASLKTSFFDKQPPFILHRYKCYFLTNALHQFQCPPNKH